MTQPQVLSALSKNDKLHLRHTEPEVHLMHLSGQLAQAATAVS
jgi:hypothetical protein